MQRRLVRVECGWVECAVKASVCGVWVGGMVQRRLVRVECGWVECVWVGRVCSEG